MPNQDDRTIAARQPDAGGVVPPPEKIAIPNVPSMADIGGHLVADVPQFNGNGAPPAAQVPD